jgi:hypothetical protein
MISRIRKTQAQNKEKERENNRKGAAEVKLHIFGDHRFDFIKACRHEAREGVYQPNCPFCKLASNAIRIHFEQEAEAKRIARLISLVKRARMRHHLLEMWAYNQGAFCSDSGK